MKRLKLHPINPQKRLMRQIVEVFQNGGLVIYSTDSGYSVGCHAYNKKAIHRLYHLKRAIKKYFMSIMVSEFSTIPNFAVVENTAYRYMKNLLPGPYTFILPATKEGAKLLDVKRHEIGIRMPQHPFFETLHQMYEEPILSTAARIQQEDFIVDPDEIEKKFGKSVDMIVDMGLVPINPTSVVSLVDGAPELIRLGAGDFH